MDRGPFENVVEPGENSLVLFAGAGRDADEPLAIDAAFVGAVTDVDAVLGEQGADHVLGRAVEFQQREVGGTGVGPVLWDGVETGDR